MIKENCHFVWKKYPRYNHDEHSFFITQAGALFPLCMCRLRKNVHECKQTIFLEWEHGRLGISSSYFIDYLIPHMIWHKCGMQREKNRNIPCAYKFFVIKNHSKAFVIIKYHVNISHN